MRKFNCLLAAIAILCSCENDLTRKNESTVFNIQNLVGSWEFHHDGTHEITRWEMDAAKNLQGIGFILHGTDTTFIEFLNITANGSGFKYSVATSSNIEEEKIEFLQLSQTANSIEFFNPNYPFPQHIVYSLINDSTILNYIEGIQDGEKVRKNFIYQKMKST